MSTGTESDFTHAVVTIGEKTHVLGKETLDTIKAALQPDGLKVSDLKTVDTIHGLGIKFDIRNSTMFIAEQPDVLHYEKRAVTETELNSIRAAKAEASRMPGAPPAPAAKQPAQNERSIFWGSEVVESQSPAGAIGAKIGEKGYPVTMSALETATRLANAGDAGLSPSADRVAGINISQLRAAGVQIDEDYTGRLRLKGSLPKVHSYLEPAPPPKGKLDSAFDESKISTTGWFGHGTVKHDTSGMVRQPRGGVIKKESWF